MGDKGKELTHRVLVAIHKFREGGDRVELFNLLSGLSPEEFEEAEKLLENGHSPPRSPQ